jgi:tryptophan synthase beta subunit
MYDGYLEKLTMSFPTIAISDKDRVYDDILQTIGKTPLVRLKRMGRDLPCPVYAKVEFFNPGGSVKDRIAVNIIEEAERSGRLKPGGTVVEATSGNTGVGLAIVCAKKGYRSIFVMPDKISQEKIQLLRAFGAKVVITPTAVLRRIRVPTIVWLIALWLKRLTRSSPTSTTTRRTRAAIISPPVLKSGSKPRDG